jgi:hypothetical protein
MGLVDIYCCEVLEASVTRRGGFVLTSGKKNYPEKRKSKEEGPLEVRNKWQGAHSGPGPHSAIQLRQW